MEGDNMDQCKSVLNKLLLFFKEHMPDASINLLLYDNNTSLMKDLNKMEKYALEKLINDIEADKGTSFLNVLQAIEGYILVQKRIDDLSIIFMTDGDIVDKNEKADDFKLIKDNINNLKDALDNCTGECDIHTIGLGKEHDSFFLERLLSIRPINSTYLFLIDDSAIEPSFRAVKDMIYMNNIRGEVSLFTEEGKEFRFKISLSEGEEDNAGVRQWQILQKLEIGDEFQRLELKKSRFRVNVCNGDLKEEFSLDSIIDKSYGVPEVSLLIKIRCELLEILNVLKERSKVKVWDMKEVEALTEKKEVLQKKYQETFLKLYKITKKKLFSLSGEIVSLKKLIDELISSAYKSNIKNDILAKAVQLAHQNIKKKKYARELFYRLKDTVPLFNEQEKEIATICKELNKNDLEKKYAIFIKDFKCCLTCYDFSEALLDQDCLCLTFDVVRTAKSIVQPQSIQIIAIYPTIISANSFLDAVKYSIDLNFDNKKEHIVKGVAQESINAALPFFLCKDHWLVARLLMDRILGWIVTLDPVGYHYTQKTAVPFLLLEFSLLEAFTKPESSFHMRYFQNVLDTCLNIMEDESNRKDSRFKTTLGTIFEGYCKDGTLRTADNNNKNSLTLLRFYCGMLLKWLNPTDEYIEEMYYCLMEEELRRIQQPKFNSYIDYQKINIFDPAMKEQERTEIIEIAYKDYSVLYENKCRVHQVIRALMLKFKKRESIDFGLVKLESEDLLIKDLKFKDKFSFFGMYFQNQIHHDNENRRKAFVNKTYFDCRAQTKEMIFKFEEGLATYKEKKEKMRSKFQKIDTKNFNMHIFNLFASFRVEKNLEEAKEMLREASMIKPGKVVFYFLNIFYKCEEIPLLVEKLRMVKELHGNWKHKLRKFYIHLLCYSNVLTKEEMLELFEEKNLPHIFRSKKA